MNRADRELNMVGEVNVSTLGEGADSAHGFVGLTSVAG